MSHPLFDGEQGPETAGDTMRRSAYEIALHVSLGLTPREQTVQQFRDSETGVLDRARRETTRWNLERSDKKPLSTVDS